MTMRRTGFALALALVANLAAPLPGRSDTMSDIIGRWRDSDGESEIAISRCGAALCGKIVWLKQERFDIYNPDAKLRTRSLLGLQVLMGFRPDAGGALAGDGYNPSDGKVYRTTLALTSPQSLVVRGCVLGGLICDDDTWSRQP